MTVWLAFRSLCLPGVFLVCAAATTLSAQVVGHLPESSPYQDVESPHELALLVGYFSAAHDPARVAPRSAPAVGIRESIHLGGPAVIYMRFIHTFSDRSAVDPRQPLVSRSIGVRRDGLTIADLGFGLNLTGDRSFRHVVPSISAGAGIASDLGAPHDVGGYRFGTRLALTYGGGLRWVPPGRLSLRVDAANYMYQHSYPASYRQVTSDGTSVIPATSGLVAWRSNGVFTLGVSYALFH